MQTPHLDDRSYADLVAEARRLIPLYDPGWTDHNPSDPGITLVELFAYLTEMLLYRLDRVTPENQRKFLKLLNGPSWAPGPDLASDISATVTAVRARDRAVTAADFERLAVNDFNDWLVMHQRAEERGEPLHDWWMTSRLDAAAAAHLPSRVPLVERASCVPARNLDRATEPLRTERAPGHVSLIVLPRGQGALNPPDTLTTALAGFLDERRLITTRLHVTGPRYAPIRVEVIVAIESDATAAAVTKNVQRRLDDFLDPFVGDRGRGWPFGRDVYVSELYEQIESVEGVDYVTDLTLASACPPDDPECNFAPPLWHQEGDLIGLAIARHVLPQLAGTSIVIAAPATSFVAVAVAVSLTRAAQADAAELKREAKLRVRKFFGPPLNASGLPAPTSVTLALANLRNDLGAIHGVASADVALKADLSRLTTQGEEVFLRLEAGEIVNWKTRVAVRDPAVSSDAAGPR